MTTSFKPRDLLRYQSISSIAASSLYAACVVNAPDEAKDSYASNIWLIPAHGGGPRRLTSGNDSAPIWSPDGTELAFVSDRDDVSQAFVMRADGGEPIAASRLKGAVSQVKWSPDGTKLLLTARQDVDPSARGERSEAPAVKGPEVAWRLPYKVEGVGYVLDRELHLFLVDRNSGNAVQLTDGPFDVHSAEFSPDGRKIAFVRTRVGRQAHRSDVWMMDADGGNAVQLSEHIALAKYVRWSPDGRWIAFSGSEEAGDSRSSLWLIDTAAGSVRALGGESLEVEAGESFHWSADSSLLYALIIRRGLQEIASLRIADDACDVLVSSERHVLKLAVTPNQLLYAAAGIDQPTELFACDLHGRNERCLTSFNRWWSERASPRASLRSFDVPDGKGGTEKIDGWLVLPPGDGKGPFPLLVDVHGGPQSIALIDYGKSMWRHVLCSRGWAVLALNPVGSSSYGLEFTNRLIGSWGELDLPQHIAAIEALQAEGIADERVAIYGKSYGGYLSAWAITQSNLFKAAVISAPVSNIESHFGTSCSGYYFTPHAMGAEPFLDRTAPRELSPLNHMHKARTPTLLLQGKEDQRCPIGQSEEIFATLMRSSDVAAEMVLYPGGNHHLAEQGPPAFRVDYVSRLVEWVEQWAGAREAPADGLV